MIYRTRPSKDTCITNSKVNQVPMTASNLGSSEILELFKIAPVSGATGVFATASLARILMQFDLSTIAAKTASFEIPSGSVLSHYLRLINAEHNETLPSSYDIVVAPVDVSWDEGKGHDLDYFSDKGFANWDKPTSTTFWTFQGGTTSSFVPHVKQHIDIGNDDIDVDITSIVNAWLTGGLVNNGLLIQLSSSYEQDTSDYYVKKFFSREAFRLERRPYIETRWDCSMKDDRRNVVFDYSSSLYLHNKVRGVPTQLPEIGTGSLYVNVTDETGSILSTHTASYTGVGGIYSVAFILSTGSYYSSTFHDVWFSGSYAYMTGTFVPSANSISGSNVENDYVIYVKNLRDYYNTDEKVRIRLYVRSKNYEPAVTSTASSDANGEIVTNAYYKIENDRTNNVVIPYGTGSVETTRLSYDVDGNYFDFYTNTLAPRETYRIVFLFNIDGMSFVYDEGYKFKVL